MKEEKAPATGPLGLRDLGPDDLLSRMTELGVLLRAEGDGLCYDAPSAVVTPELLTALSRNKASLLSRLKAGVERRAPVTFQQRGFIAFLQRHGVPQVYNVAMRLTCRGSLDVTALRAALSALVARHEALRTRYVHADGEWWQEVLRPQPVDLPVDDLTALPDDARAAEIERMSARLADAPFDLSTGVAPVCRLLRAGERRWVLLVVLHHISCDAWALSVLLNELAALYRAAAAGLPDGLERSMQATEYALRQRDRPVANERRLEYWARQLAGVPFRVDLPTDRPRAEALSGRGDAVLFTISADVRAKVEAFARRHGATPFAVTTATLGVLLAQLSGQSDIVLGVPYANRERRALENLVACAAVTFALRIRVAEAESFAALVETVASDTIDAISNIMPLWEIAAGVNDIPDRPPIGFQYQNALETNVDFPGMTVAIEDLVVPAARGEFYSGLIPTGDVISGYIEYSTDLWDRETVEQWADAYKELLRDAVEGRVNLMRRL
jgi:hypothetical protein